MPRRQAPSSEAPLRAQNGDRLVVRSHRVGEKRRDGDIIEVLGDDGAPPYVVRWLHDGRVTRVFPGSDSYVERLSPARLAR
ncbi:MAG TPA: DUF1918 domain-containing protein [Gaiellaceae bacterium]|nr:DUF1918 domain-containing protein [Gaiellaceae bacterium]